MEKSLTSYNPLLHATAELLTFANCYPEHIFHKKKQVTIT